MLDAVRTELFVGWRFVDTPLGGKPEARSRLKLDAYVGGRLTNKDIDTTLSASAQRLVDRRLRRIQCVGQDYW